MYFARALFCGKIGLAMKSFRRAAAALLALFLFSCTTAPYTGRSQLMLVSEPEEVKLGAEAFTEQLRDSVLSDNPDAYRIVRRVGERISRAQVVGAGVGLAGAAGGSTIGSLLGLGANVG